MEYPPLRDYGVIGNDDRCALVSRHGSIDWCCFPHLENSSVFARLLDAANGGHFAVSPTEPHEASFDYADRTNVLETTFETADGQATLTDFMPIRDGSDGEDRDSAAEELFQQAIYRRLECDRGEIDLEIEFAPRFDYARTTPTLERVDDGVLATASEEEEEVEEEEAERLALYADGKIDDLEISSSDTTVTGTASLEAGESCWAGVQYGGREPLASGDPEAVLDETKQYWRAWLGDREETAESMPERWHEMVVRSELVLKVLIHQETGAIPAAATTSVPEKIGSDRTWDYRYNWIRDAKFTVQALHDTGHREEARKYFEWFADIARTAPEDIQPLYGLHGETDIVEQELEHLSGYRDTGPVRIGNGAAPQRQLDVYGTIVQAIYETIQFDESTELDGTWDSIRSIVDYVCAHWDERDAGIWEFRDEQRHFLHSKLLCWVALDRGLALASEHDLEAPIDRWERSRDDVRDAIETRGYSDEAGSFTQHFESDEAIDAVALLVPIYEFLPPDDDRVQSTIDTVLERLTTDDGLVVRFVDSNIRPDEETGFVLCSFWLIDALVLSNRIDLAREYFENLLEYASPLGLYSEKIDPANGTLLGNFPQAFSHLGVINSVSYLSRALEADGDVVPEDFHPDHVETLFRRGGP